MALKIKTGHLSIFILFFCLFPGLLFAQDDRLSTKSKKAERAFQDGEAAYRMQLYTKAVRLFNEAIDDDPQFFEAYVMVAEVYNQLKQDSNAVLAYRKALEIDTTSYPMAWFLMAELEYHNGWYEDALGHYNHFLDSPAAKGKDKNDAVKHATNCAFAIDAMKHPVPFDPFNLGRNVNTPANEYFPCLTADNRELLFTRLLKDPKSFTGRQEDFFTSRKSDGGWSMAVNIGPPINTLYNEGAPSLSADGNTLIFTACESVNGYGRGREGYGRCDLFISHKVGDHWSVPENMGPPVSSRFWESQPSISADGRTLYFVSNRDNDYDIWVTQQDDAGSWSPPTMLGSNINTDGYEGSVFIHPDNQTLYFSSDGHVGMGGMDIYMSRKDTTGEWGEPVNLGYPINTWKDENSILISADGQLAMFASDRKEGYGGLDLYAFELYEKVRPKFVTYLKGTVFDAETHEKLEAHFELTNLKTGKVAVRSFSNKGNGEFLVCLPTEQDYALTVSKDGYLFYSENFNLTGVNTTTNPFLKDIPLKPIKVGETVVLKNIFFETDKYNLKEASKVELNKLIALLNKNPGMKIEISGHTDNVGTPEYNLELSKNRAKAVNDYLVANGIDQARLVYKGYGESQPVDTNETEAGRANNRRTEFKVIGE